MEKKVCTFSIATSNSWKDKDTGEKKEKTEWHRVVVFNEGLIGVVENYIKKGTKLYIEGALLKLENGQMTLVLKNTPPKL